MGMVAPGVVLDNLSWVVTKTANIGVDFDLWNGKLFGTVEVYRRVNDGILASRIMDIPNTFGASFPKENINSEENTGLKLNSEHAVRLVRTLVIPSVPTTRSLVTNSWM